jgi:septal ring factor EnvC (AmiA/AmiB activator)
VPPQIPEFQQSLESHEDRLQRVESNVQDLVAQSTSISVKQDYLAEKVAEQGQATMARLDSGFETIQKDHKEIRERQEDLEGRVHPLEVAHRNRKRRWDLIKKVILPLAAAAAGVFGTRFSESLWQWFSS